MELNHDNFTEFLLYTDPNGKVKVEIFLKDENITPVISLTPQNDKVLFLIKSNTQTSEVVSEIIKSSRDKSQKDFRRSQRS